MSKVESDLLLPREVAVILRLKVNTIYEAAADGRLPHVLIWRGGRKRLLRFRRSDVEALLRPGAAQSELKG